MKLTPEQADRFYAIWWPLLSYVNDRRRLFPGRPAATDRAPLTFKEALPLRAALWADESLREAFVAENPAGLVAADLATVASWKHRVAGMFTVWKHYKKHSIFLHDREAFAVLGLRSTLEEIMPMPPPMWVDAVLLPFDGVIVIDGLMTSQNVLLGPGIRRGLKEEYDDAIERGAVRTSLLPISPADAAAQHKASRKDTNRKVLADLRRYLYGTRRLTEATAERDLRVIAAFAEGLTGDRSLRACEVHDVEAALAAAPTLSGNRTQTVAALKRFFTFMVETGRLEPELGRSALNRLRG